MVLTRSERNKLLALGLSEEAMENVPTTSTTAISDAANIPAAVATSAATAPAVQQVLSGAEFSNMPSTSQGATNSVTTPPFSSLTARNDVPPVSQPTVAQPSSQEGLWQANISRQLQDFERSMQDFMRTMAQPQAAVADRAASARVRTPPNMANNFYDEAPWEGSYSRHFRPVGEPQYAHFGPNPSTFDMPPHYPPPAVQRVDLSKWGLKFDGSSKSMTAEDFIFRLDVLRQDYGCSFSDILRSFHLLLEGQALDWYWNLRRTTPLRTWQDLEAAFLTQYRRFESEFQVQKKIMDRRQLPQESFEEFYNSVIKLRNQQRSPYSERDLVEIMRSNLKPALSHLLFSVNVSTLHEFCQQAKRAESLINSQRHQYPARTFPPQRVSELAYVEDMAYGGDPEVEALTARSSYTCWNCRQTGHSFMDCPSPHRRLFCYRCGRDGVVTPKCPKCQGNSEKNKPHSGQARSTQT